LLYHGSIFTSKKDDMTSMMRRRSAASRVRWSVGSELYVTIVRCALALVALGAAARAEYQVTHGEQTIAQLWLFLISAAVFALAVPTDALPLAPLLSPRGRIGGHRLSNEWMTVVPALIVLILSLTLFWDNRARGTAFFIWWTAMIWYVGSYLPTSLEFVQRMRQVIARIPRFSALVALVIMIAVTLVNFWDLGSIPYGLWWDEANFGLYAQQILHHTIDFPLLAPFGDPALEFYFHAVEQLVFGATEASTRVLVALCGTAVVGLVGVLTLMLWNRWMALVVMIVLGFMRWHIDFSRFGIHEMVFEFFEMAILVTLVAGIQQRRPVWFALCGVLIGLSMNIYSPAFALAGLVLLALAWGYVLLKPQIQLSLITLVLIGVALGYAPLLEAGIQDPALFNARAKQVSILGEVSPISPTQRLINNLRAHARMFNVEGDHNGRHNIPGEPQLDAISAVFFLLGLAWALFRARRPPYALLILWFLAMMAPAVLSLDFEAPQSARAAGAQPVVALFIAIGIWGVLSLVRRTFDCVWPKQHVSKWIMAAAVVALLSLVSVTNVRAYFDAELHNEIVWETWATDATFVGKEMQSIPARNLLYISPVLIGQPSIDYLAPGHLNQVPVNPPNDFPFRMAGPIDVFLARTDASYFPVLKQEYPHGQFRALLTPKAGDPPLVYEARLSRAVVAATAGLKFEYRQTHQVERAHVGDLAFPLHTGSGPGQATWTGGIEIPTYEQATFTVQAEGFVQVALDGRQLCAGRGVARCTARWARGDHALMIRVAVPAAHGPPVLHWSWSSSNKPAFFALASMGHGLSAAYYPNGNWRGPPAFVQIEPQVDFYYQYLPLPRPFSVEWRGTLLAPRTGRYTFSLDSIDDSSIALDGHPVLHVGSNRGGAAKATLRRGPHHIVVRFLAVNNFTHIYLRWTVPGSIDSTYVPSGNFRP
jgi:4-amino-4-deoxy-L-arabinose transferase-like glycosyltransferase